MNAVLRNYLRRREALEADARRSEPGRFGYPQWWIDRVRHAQPGGWEAILAAGNDRPPLTLRVNRRRLSVDAYLARLAAEGIAAARIGESAVRLDRPRGVDELPGFRDGDVSVQDAGAQLAAPLLDVRDGMRVLDACAAPGGKTAHLAELADLDLRAIDRDAGRVTRIADNLERLHLAATVSRRRCGGSRVLVGPPPVRSHPARCAVQRLGRRAPAPRHQVAASRARPRRLRT